MVSGNPIRRAGEAVLRIRGVVLQGRYATCREKSIIVSVVLSATEWTESLSIVASNQPRTLLLASMPLGCKIIAPGDCSDPESRRR